MISQFFKSWGVLVILVLATTASNAYATVEINIEKTWKIDEVPVEVVVSRDGSRTFVLTDSGNILIYNRNGDLSDTIKIGSHVSHIELDPTGEKLFATSRQNKTVEIISIDFIHQINTQGSPYKGPQDAPVTIAVFSDFQ